LLLTRNRSGRKNWHKSYWINYRKGPETGLVGH
jgi:hypothetical protein